MLVLSTVPIVSQKTEAEAQQEIKLPSGKSQRDEILKAEHQQSLRDLAQILKLAGELRAELEKNDYQVVSVSSLKKSEEIEKLAKHIRTRLKKF